VYLERGYNDFAKRNGTGLCRDAAMLNLERKEVE
jgi:hypothetical protein